MLFLPIHLMFTYQAQCFRYLYLTFQKEVYTFHCSVSSIYTNATYVCFLAASWHCWWLLSYFQVRSYNHKLLSELSTTLHFYSLFWNPRHDLRFILIKFIFLVFIQHSSLLRQPESQSCHQLLYCLFFPVLNHLKFGKWHFQLCL